MALLEVSHLSINYKVAQDTVHAVSDVSLKLQKGEFLGLIGESGCGKTTVATAIAKILPPNAEVIEGEILFKDRNLLDLDKDQVRKLRWHEIAIVPQSSMNSLDPVYPIRSQMVEAVRSHTRMEKKKIIERASEMFNLVGLDAERLSDYPHQFSGGMKQRAIIAMSLILDPSLIIADEPTTGLDVVVQDQILLQFTRIMKDMHKSVLLITHDISIVAENCDRVAVMYGGRIVETGKVRDILKSPFHPYSIGLQNAFPNIRGSQKVLISMPGYPPDLLTPIQGCAFADRCPFVTDLCRHELPPFARVGSNHYSLCHYTDRVSEFRDLGKEPETWMR